MLFYIQEFVHKIKADKFARGQLITGLVFLALMAMWRVSSIGTDATGRIDSMLRTEIENQYKHTIYKKFGMYDEQRSEKRSDQNTPKNFPHEDITNLKVTINNLSISAPIWTFSATEDIVARFDYKLTADGITKQEANDVYLRVPGRGSKLIDSQAFMYYLHYLL